MQILPFMTNKLSRLCLGALACAALVALSPSVMATPVAGTLNLSGAITFDATFENFCAPPGPCAAAPGNWTVPGGTGTGDLGIPYANDPNGGLITNLTAVNAPVGTLLPGNGLLLLTFAPSGALPTPDIQFYLTELFAGVGGTANCTAAPAPGQICAPSGTALTFINDPGGTSTLTITAVGLAERISTSEFDPLSIILTSQFSTPYQTVLSAIAADGSVTDNYSATFVATPVSPTPEPTSLTLMLTGVVVLFLVMRKRLGLGLPQAS